MILSDKTAKRCATANGWTIYQGKTLLVKHKKLGIWLSPGGHIEENELPHQAAEREFEEETGVKVKAISAYPNLSDDQWSEYLPVPFCINLHEINKPRGNSFCEQHYSIGYFLKLLDLSGLHKRDAGVDDVRWFTKEEVSKLDTHDNIKSEAKFVFEHFPV